VPDKSNCSQNDNKCRLNGHCLTLKQRNMTLSLRIRNNCSSKKDRERPKKTIGYLNLTVYRQ
jgi:hypothetical protein